MTESFPLNAIDATFLLSSDAKTLTDLPNSIYIYFPLKQKIEKDKLITTLIQIDERYPRLKLATTLDQHRVAWIRHNNPKSHFEHVVSEKKFTKNESIDVYLSSAIRKAIYDMPLEIVITPQYFLFRQNHSFGDALYALTLIELILAGYHGGVDSLPKLDIAPPLQASDFGEAATKEEKIHLPETIYPHIPSITPFRSRDNQYVVNTVLTAEQLGLLDAIRHACGTTPRISINTLINVLITYALNLKGLQNKQTLLSMPTSLAKYMQKDRLYPYNCIAIMDTIIDTPSDTSSVVQTLRDTQKRINTTLTEGHLLSKIHQSITQYAESPATYIATNQHSYRTFFDNIEQTFVLSNIGFVDMILHNTKQYFMQGSAVFVSAPTIGSQPLTVFLTRIDGQGNVSCTVDTARMAIQTVNDIWDSFSPINLTQLLEAVQKTT